MKDGGVLGILGGGQLGKMLIEAGKPMGYRFVVLDPDKDCPAAMVADQYLCAEYDDELALEELAGLVDGVTLEFENVPLGSLEFLKKRVSVWPGPEVLAICRNRRREKEFLKSKGFPVAEFAYVNSVGDLEEALKVIGGACVLKTVELGYDGKGQVKLSGWESRAALELIWERFGNREGILEKWVDFECECSVICARNGEGDKVTFPVARNEHRNHILHQSVVPSGLGEVLCKEASELAKGISDELGVVGLLAVEFFVKKDGGLLINELAPRPHNSGHYTMDVCLTSQFEQHIRAGIGLAFGGVDLLKSVVMVNLLGDLWMPEEPNWSEFEKEEHLKLHLYGKKKARPGRKMGHFNLLGDDGEKLIEEADKLWRDLRSPLIKED